MVFSNSLLSCWFLQTLIEIAQTEREKKNPVRRRRQFRAERKEKKKKKRGRVCQRQQFRAEEKKRKRKKEVLSVKLPKPRFQDLALRPWVLGRSGCPWRSDTIWPCLAFFFPFTPNLKIWSLISSSSSFQQILDIVGAHDGRTQSARACLFFFPSLGWS